MDRAEPVEGGQRVRRAEGLGPGACGEKRDEAAFHAGGKTRDAQPGIGADADDGLEPVSQWERIEHAACSRGLRSSASHAARSGFGLYGRVGLPGWAGRRLAKLTR